MCYINHTNLFYPQYKGIHVNKEVKMLKLTLQPGEYLDIGENIRVVFTGGSARNAHLMIDAPREISIVRSNAGGKKAAKDSYYVDKGISEEAKKEIVGIIMREKAQGRRDNR